MGNSFKTAAQVEKSNSNPQPTKYSSPSLPKLLKS